MDSNTKLLSQKLAIEQRIFLLKKKGLNEDKHQHMLHKLENMLVVINKSINEGSDDVEADNGNIEKNTHDQQPDHEVNMARSDLHRTAHAAIALSKILSHISEEQGLEGWVQAKITKAADYLDTVYHYLEYEMKSDEGVNEDVGKVRPYGPGQQTGEDAPVTPPSPTASPSKNYVGPGGSSPESGVQPPQAKSGQMSPTPPSGGATPVPTAPGHVKMMRLGPHSEPLGTPITVPESDVETKQRAGFRVIESASAGASSAGGIAGSPTGFANGGIGMQKRKKKKFEEVEETVEKDEGPKFTGYWKGKDKGTPGKKMVGSD
jgi:hypothetical protein